MNKRFAGILASGVLVVCFTVATAHADTEYFPPHAFKLDNLPSGRGDISGSLARQFSEALDRMDEPSLWEKARKTRRLETFRFLWLPGFDSAYRPTTVRIERTGRQASLTMTQIGRNSEVDAGTIVMRKQSPLTPDQWNRLVSLAYQADFWHMPARIDDLGLDGESFMVEGVKDGEYHVIYRWTPDPGAFRELCRYMIDLTGLNMGQSHWPTPPRSRTWIWLVLGLSFCLATILCYAILRGATPEKRNPGFTHERA